MSIVETARNAVKAAAETALSSPAVQKVTGRGQTEPAGPVTLTIAVDIPTARGLWLDTERLSSVLGDVATVSPGEGDVVVWTLDGASDDGGSGNDPSVETTRSEDGNTVRFARADGGTDLAVVRFAEAPLDLGTEVTLDLALPVVPDVAARVAAFKVLYRARALLQTGEIPTLVPTPAARPGEK